MSALTMTNEWQVLLTSATYRFVLWNVKLLFTAKLIFAWKSMSHISKPRPHENLGICFLILFFKPELADVFSNLKNQFSFIKQHGKRHQYQLGEKKNRINFSLSWRTRSLTFF